ncbi:hypothetical protein VM98_23455 [Streptomyces rubellomurinus subsp. indigoferus]|uniref:Secreted protein n=1 Tax=Streptomyces rubellomurinus (strain ATCC 31215) TaxID=359131 RepID=A0A0F2TA15_STRR3|nr:hypothetical protein [Streptomyces rubellomurinus]KJS53747.1 hypothetical protein VM98_23455 [Streptomyces rubellomurinus subsp. indigoferus]KJS58587.1 hypothetical protein VM95_32445 [Streptomyces rubellomurinus]
MNRITRLAVGAAGAAAMLAVPAPALAQPGAAAAATVTTCGYSGLQAGLGTKVCADVTGGSVVIYGQIGLAGPPSPDTPWPPAPRELITRLSAEVVGGPSLGSVSGRTVFTVSTVRVDGISATVACGSVVHATFALEAVWPVLGPVTADVPVNC